MFLMVVPHTPKGDLRLKFNQNPIHYTLNLAQGCKDCSRLRPLICSYLIIFLLQSFSSFDRSTLVQIQKVGIGLNYSWAMRYKIELKQTKKALHTEISRSCEQSQSRQNKKMPNSMY